MALREAGTEKNYRRNQLIQPPYPPKRDPGRGRDRLTQVLRRKAGSLETEKKKLGQIRKRGGLMLAPYKDIKKSRGGLIKEEGHSPALLMRF